MRSKSVGSWLWTILTIFKIKLKARKLLSESTQKYFLNDLISKVSFFRSKYLTCIINFESLSHQIQVIYTFLYLPHVFNMLHFPSFYATYSLIVSSKRRMNWTHRQTHHTVSFNQQAVLIVFVWTIHNKTVSCVDIVSVGFLT